jgi:TonB family protein
LERLNQRQGFLVSVILHLMILMTLASRTPAHRSVPKPEPVPERKQTVFLPPPEVLRQLLPPRARRPAPPPVPRPVPTPEPPSPRAKDKISIGAPSDQKAKGPLLLRKEDDLTATPKGKPNAVPTPPPTAPPDTQVARNGAAGASPVPGETGGLKLPNFGQGSLARGDEGSKARPGEAGSPSIAESLRNLERHTADIGPAGLPTGTGQQMGPLFFDPEGADFTLWINQFKNEVYRNWIMPQPAIMGYRGHVDFEFTVERDGKISSLKLLKTSGTPALDRAAQNALVGSRLLPLPADYGPPRVTMQVSFFYNEAPQGS